MNEQNLFNLFGAPKRVLEIRPLVPVFRRGEDIEREKVALDRRLKLRMLRERKAADLAKLEAVRKSLKNPAPMKKMHGVNLGMVLATSGVK